VFSNTNLHYLNCVGIVLKGDGATRTIQLTGTGSLFTVKSGVTLTLDSGITLSGVSNNTAALVVTEGGTLVMKDGATIRDNANSGDGGGVCGRMIMNGGTITGNSATNGGGVSGGITINGGTITGNSATNGGGVAYLYDYITINGGTISNNTATENGGGVKGYVTMSGGTISGNSAAQNGGGVHGSVLMSGGTITGNTATGHGSGVTDGDLRMSGGARITEDNTVYLNYGQIEQTGAFTGIGAVAWFELENPASRDNEAVIKLADWPTSYAGPLEVNRFVLLNAPGWHLTADGKLQQN
jgi:hypothetical protein